MKGKVTPIDKHVGNRVRMRRFMLHMTQAQLGQALGVSFQQVHKYEQGGNRTSAGRLQQLGDVLKVSVPFFFEGLAGPPQGSHQASRTDDAADVNEFVSTATGLALVKAYTRIKNPKMRLSIVHLVEKLAATPQGKRAG